MKILEIIDLILFIPVVGTTLYMAFFALAAVFYKRHKVPDARHQNRFIVLIPSYKQDKVIEQTVLSVLRQTYPQRMFDIVVVSDHQQEMTNMRLAQYPITLLTPDFEESTKAKSLQYALLHLPAFKIYDIALLLDADNVIGEDFLMQMNNAFEGAGTKAIQAHRISRNRDTSIARMDAIFEEINNTIFRRGHIVVGLSSATCGSGIAFDFNWFKTNIMKARSAGEDKEIEAMLMRQHIFVDYYEDIIVYDEKTRQTESFNKQRNRWAADQLHSLLRNIHLLPGAILSRHWDLVDKIIQWMLVPRIILMAIIMIMSIAWPFIWFTPVIKWWVVAAVVMFVYAMATPDYLVDETWNKTFLGSPLMSLWGLFHIIFLGKKRSTTNKSKKAE